MGVTVVGGGLAGCEAAWQAAERGAAVKLYEMRPVRATPAHATDRLAELVCSNSLGSKLPDRATGLLLTELQRLGSLLTSVAAETSVPAGGALAVDRAAFAERVTRAIADHPQITLVRKEVTAIPTARPAVLATGPLTSDGLAAAIQALTGQENLSFFDALAPIVQADSVDMTIAFRASRYERGEQEGGDYVNCPFTREEYERFVAALLAAETIPLRGFEQADRRFFEGCLAVEVLARRDPRALTFGPMRPVGLRDPRTGRRPYAIVQLRQDNLAGSLYNLVGFQTNLKWPEQEHVFRLIPGLERAVFVRHGQMHRNTFLKSPAVLEPTLAFRDHPGLFCAGQLAGVEGYLGSVATGWLAGVNAVRRANGQDPVMLPPETMLGALCRYVARAEIATFQPMKANFDLLPPLAEPGKSRPARREQYVQRALASLECWKSGMLEMA
jgi:methylenetetrahydrofolate--tRNA-(uracil-5-)-methyltransferase